MPFSQEPFRDPSAPLFEQRINELEKAEGAGEITTAKLPAEVVTGAKLAPAIYAKRVLATAGGTLTAAKATGEYFFVGGAGELTVATAGVVEYAPAGPVPAIIPAIIPANVEVTGRTPKLSVRLNLLANAKASGSTYTAGLYKVSASKGATGKNAVTYALVAGSTAAIAAPVAESFKTKESALFAVPSETAYGLGVEVTVEALKAESQVLLSAELLLSYT